MVHSSKISLLFAIVVGLLPVVTSAADAPQTAPKAPAAAGGGGSKAGGGGGPPSQGGNIGAVDAILNPGGGGAGKKAAAQANIPPEPMSEEDTRDRVMDNSINSYMGYCACPYSKNSDGFECGVEAAYYKPGGFRIFCYPEDVRGQLNIFYRKTH
ncbi:MAG: hypothetical protein HYX61_05620 [Gammaproteobacteria bacterium]|jgi:hypothetical protein|nr:hypothetical protein [Gammaproteobacteria bacterium]